MSELSPLLVVLGPTSSGKSAHAESLALRQGGEILNADSQQFYRGFDIGTGKVSPAQRRVPHHLLDLCAPGEFIDAGSFAKRAEALLIELRGRNSIPVVVGGTGLYLRSLLEGLDPLPPRDEAIRCKLRQQFETEGGEALHHQLAQVDPISAAKIHPQDPSRLIRYLEIYQVSGHPPSRLMKGRRPEKLRHRVHVHWLNPPREILRRRIAERVRGMFAEGWVEEVRGLLARGIDPRNLANKPIGYVEIANHLQGKGGLQSCIEAIILRTQQYAKRQNTFFKGLLTHSAYRENGNKVEVFGDLAACG